MLARWVAEATGTVWQRDERVLCCAQVSQEAAELRGSLRFIACLFKEHLLPITFIHTLVLDFLGHVQACSLPSPCSIHLHLCDLQRCCGTMLGEAGVLLREVMDACLLTVGGHGGLHGNFAGTTSTAQTHRAHQHNPLSIAR